MNKILFSERLAGRRKECGYKTQYALAEEYNKRFPSSRKNRKEENSGNSSGILGTIKHYENGNYNGSPKLDIVDNLCRILECNVDYLLGNIDCTTHDIQFIRNETGLSEKAIEELHYLTVLNSALADEPDLNTINTLLEQLRSQYNNIIHAITGYLRSNGLSKDTWYDIRSETLSEKKPPIDTDGVRIPAHSETFDNLMLMDIQKRIMNLKDEIKKTPDTN